MMDEKVENLEAPNWLKELEATRERRVKGRLGHEAGAGAPCLTCSDKCPGLDLHFWRKICKNCKCTKESHDVNDDDIYGYAQFQLLGSKPNKIKHKIVLPGKKDEIELDWAPKGTSETINKYLQSVPLELLPVKGSAAAQERKQLLQKQIPIHDVDPSLCHDLTETEYKKMYDYIEHMKTASVGVGQVVHLGELQQQMAKPLNYNDKKDTFVGGGGGGGGESGYLQAPHQFSTLEPVESQYYNSEIIKPIPNSYHHRLPQQLEGLNINSPIEDNQDPKIIGGIHDLNYDNNTTKELNAFFDKVPNPINMTDYLEENSNRRSANWGQSLKNKEMSHLNTELGGGGGYDGQQSSSISNIKALAYSTYDPNSNYQKQLPYLNPLNNHPIDDIAFPNQVNIGIIRDINYDPINPTNPIKYDDDKLPLPPPQPRSTDILKTCKRCNQPIIDFAVYVKRSHNYYHSSCFKCNACNQNIADMVYFFDRESGDIYCGRDYAKIRGIPRCKACDELIFVKEYCLAENSTFHIKHFCCFECDIALAGQNYVIEDSQPLCLPCFEKLKANKCEACHDYIQADEQGALLKDLHFHANEKCFACKVCGKCLLNAKLLLRNRQLYCSIECYQNNN